MAGVGKTGGGVDVGKCVDVGPNLRGVAVKDEVGGIVVVLSATVPAGEVGVAVGTGSVNAVGEVTHAVRLLPLHLFGACPTPVGRLLTVVLFRTSRASEESPPPAGC